MKPIRYRPSPKRSSLVRIISFFIIFIIMIGFVITSDIIKIKNEMENIDPPSISSIKVSENRTEISYYISYPDSYSIYISANCSILNESIKIEKNLANNYDVIYIDIYFHELLPYIFDGIIISFSGFMTIRHIEKNYEKNVYFNVTYEEKADITLTSLYYPINYSHWGTLTTCDISIPFLIYQGNISLSYVTCFELIESEMEDVSFPNNGIEPGMKILGIYNETKIFKNQIEYSDDTISYDLSKIYYDKNNPEDVKDLCGKYLDFRVAINIDQENNTAPDPIYYFENITCIIDNVVIPIDRKKTIIKKM